MSETAVVKTATPKEIKEFFGYAKLTEFSADWKALDDKSKAQIREGIGSGTFTY